MSKNQTYEKPFGIATTEWPILSGEIPGRITQAREAEKCSTKPDGSYQQAMQYVVNRTIGPKLRTDYDSKYARNIISSGVTTAVATAIALGTDNLGVDTLAATIQGYGATDVNYVNHQNTHVHLMPKAPEGKSDWQNKLLKFHLSVASGMPEPIWKIQHVRGHHSHGERQGFGELNSKDVKIDRRTSSGFIKLLAHDTLKTPEVLLGPVGFLILEMAKETAKGVPLKEHITTPGLLAYNIGSRVTRALSLEESLPVPAEKIQEVKALLKEAGLPKNELDSLIYDTHIEINHLKDLAHIMAAWSAIGVLISVNYMTAVPYFLTQIFTKCTEALNHIYPDGSGHSKGMINVNPKLSRNNPGFAWHLVHHFYPFLHPQYYGIIVDYWQKMGLIDSAQYEDCPVYPGADSSVLSRLIPEGLSFQAEYMACDPKVSNAIRVLNNLI